MVCILIACVLSDQSRACALTSSSRTTGRKPAEAVLLSTGAMHPQPGLTGAAPVCRFHESKAIEVIRTEYAEDISRFIAMQYLFDRQWKALRVRAQLRPGSVANSSRCCAVCEVM